MHRKVLKYHGHIDCYDATFLYEDIIHTNVPFASRALYANAENGVSIQSIFGKKAYIAATTAGRPMEFIYSGNRAPFSGKDVYFSEGQNPIGNQIEIIDAFRYRPSIGFWKLHLTLPFIRERVVHARKLGKGEYEITLEAGSKRDLARMERLLSETLEEESQAAGKL